MRKLAYILAASHSGSTLLAMLIGAHPEACTAGELKISNIGDPDHYRCGCGIPIKTCDFWKKVATEMGKKGVDFDISAAGTNIFNTSNRIFKRLLSPLHRGVILETLRDIALAILPGWHRHKKQVLERNAQLIESLLEISGAKVIVDSSKVALRLKYLLQDKENDIRIIRLIRDGRGVALTYTDPYSFADAQDPSMRAGGFGGDRDGERCSIAQAAHEWRRSNEEAEALLSIVNKSKWVEVRYEEVCKDPDATLKKICSFLELDPEKIVHNFRSVRQHVIGNGMRLDSSSAIVYDDRWRTNLTKEQLSIFNDIAGALNRKYGYV